MWITSMGNHGAAGGISECRRSSCSSWKKLKEYHYDSRQEHTTWHLRSLASSLFYSLIRPTSKINWALYCPLCRNPLVTGRIPSEKGSDADSVHFICHHGYGTLGFSGSLFCTSRSGSPLIQTNPIHLISQIIRFPWWNCLCLWGKPWHNKTLSIELFLIKIK